MCKDGTKCISYMILSYMQILSYITLRKTII